jgi:manganese transport protein
MGTGHLAAVGYMDTGNWATEVTAGSAVRYRCPCHLLSSCVAMILRGARRKLGIVTGMDLPQACGSARKTGPCLSNLNCVEFAITAFSGGSRSGPIGTLP